MGDRSPEIDAYIARSPEFARPILTRIRDAFHAGCPEVEERIKWGSPSFEYDGILGGMAAFKKHVSFGFWKSRLMSDPERLFAGKPRASAMSVRVESLGDLPPRRVLLGYVREAKRLNETKVAKPARARPRKPEVAVPPDLRTALARNATARKTFESFPPSCRREYVEWVTAAKGEETRKRRLETALAWMTEGKRQNWRYDRKR